MLKIKVGQRVRWKYDGKGGTVTALVGASSFRVLWDKGFDTGHAPFGPYAARDCAPGGCMTLLNTGLKICKPKTWSMEG